MRTIWFVVLAIAGCCWQVEARAATPVTPPAFGSYMLSDLELSGARAGYVEPQLSRSRISLLADNQARNDFRETAGVARLTMDIWWGSTGQDLVFANVRPPATAGVLP